METAKRTAILLILALLATTIAQSVDKPLQDEPPTASKTQISQTRTASCLVKVTADPATLPLDVDTIQYLLESSAVAGKAAREVLGIASFQDTRPFEITIDQLTGPAGGYGGAMMGGGMGGYGGGMMGGGYGQSTSASPRSSRRPPALPPAPGEPHDTSIPRLHRGLPSTEQPTEPQQEPGKTPPTKPPRRSTTSSSQRSSSSTRPSSNQQTSYGYSRTAKTPATPTRPRPTTMSTAPRVLGIMGNEALISGRWYKAGENIGDAKILEIQPTYVKIEQQGRQKTLFPTAAPPTAASRYRSTSNPQSNQTRYGSSTNREDYYDRTAPPEFPGSYSRSSSTSTGDPYNVGSSSGYYSSYSRTPKTTSTRITTRPSAAARPTSQTQTILFRLQVDISDQSAKPAAKEFLNALIANFRDVLESAFAEYNVSIESELKFAERRRDLANAQLSKIMAEAQPEVSIPAVESDPANLAIKRQLNETIDLSALIPTMPFDQAIDQIKNSVAPPLIIVVLWRDIYDNAEIEATTEINMNGPSQVPLHKALSLLLKSVAGSFSDGLGYSIDDGVITIATEFSIPREMITLVYEVPGLAYSGGTATTLADVILQTIEPDSWLQNEDGSGDGEITPYLGSKLAIRQTVDVHSKIKKFLADTLASDAPLAILPDIPPETFMYEKQELQRHKLRLDMDVARFKARRTAIEQAVTKISVDVAQRLGNDSVTAELEKILEINATLLAATKKRYDSGTISGAEIQQVEEKLARARIELAKRREELGLAAGGNELANFNSELTTLAIDVAQKTAELRVLNTQLGRTQTQLAMATTLNPQLSELRYAKEEFDAAQQRVSQLKTRIANLTPPTVTVIGAD